MAIGQISELHYRIKVLPLGVLLLMAYQFRKHVSKSRKGAMNGGKIRWHMAGEKYRNDTNEC